MITEQIQLHNEDCYETLRRIPSRSIDLHLTDSPFGCTQNEWDIKPDLQKMWPEWLRVAKPNAAIIFFATQPFASELIISKPELFRYDLIWYKSMGTVFLNANKMPLRNHETVLVFYQKLPTYNPQMRIGQMRKKGGAKVASTNYRPDLPSVSKVSDSYHPQSVIDIPNGDRENENDHPTQKPIDLIRYLVRTYSNEGDTVFDGYSGSGTTPAACIEENRKFIGAEMDTKYYQQSVKRLQTMLCQPLLLR